MLCVAQFHVIVSVTLRVFQQASERKKEKNRGVLLAFFRLFLVVRSCHTCSKRIGFCLNQLAVRATDAFITRICVNFRCASFWQMSQGPIQCFLLICWVVLRIGVNASPNHDFGRIWRRDQSYGGNSTGKMISKSRRIQWEHSRGLKTDFS